MIPAATSPSALADGPAEQGWLAGRRGWLTAVLLMVLAWLIYLPTLQYGFIDYDDVRILKDHPELYGQTTLAADLHAIFVTEFPREEPLPVRDVFWAVESRLFGFGNPVGYHLGNVLLHGAVVALLFTFLLRATRRYGFALALTGLYLALAVHVEPVAWIMGLKDILSALFMLLALLAQMRRLAARNFATQCAWFAVTLLCFATGLLSKISVLTFPAVLWLHALLLPYLGGELAPADPFRRYRVLLRETAWLIPCLAVSGMIYIWYQRTLAQMGLFDRGYTAHGCAHLWNLLMVNPLGFWLYLRQIFWPSHLAIQYWWPEFKLTYPWWQVLVSLGTVAGAAGAGLWLWLRRKDLFFYYAAFFVLMIPYLNLLYIGIWVADRYVYFSVLCVLAIALSAAAAAWRRSTGFFRVALVAIGAALLAKNVGQSLAYAPVWRNGETLWQYHVTLPDHPAAAYGSLGGHYYADFADAIARRDTASAAVSLRKLSLVVEAGLAEFWVDRRQAPPPQTQFLFFLRSLVEEVQGNLEAALASLLMADRLSPGSDSTNLNLSRLYRKLADVATDPAQRAVDLRAARDRYAAYMKIAYGRRSTPAPVRQEMADLDAACAALPAPSHK